MLERTTEELWREALMGIPSYHLAMRRAFSRLPSSGILAYALRTDDQVLERLRGR